ncbi:MAG: IPTL-CTERM sorting domain-containing protein [Betaproteobacteria bacterium]
MKAARVFAAFAVSPFAHALTYPVTTLADSGAGSLRQAVLDANGNAGVDDITFAVAGTIVLTSGELVVTDSVNILGPGARTLTVSANLNSRVLRMDNVAAKDVLVSGLTLTDGLTNGNGGAILNEGSNLTLRFMTITGNQTAAEGGAIYNQFFGGGNVLTIENSEISANRANKNGAIYFIGFQLRIANSTIYNNVATDSVGAILLQFGDAVIRNSTIASNSPNFVGGIQSQDSTLVLESTILADNTDSTGVNDINRTGNGTVSATNSLFEEDVTATSVINGTDSGNIIGVDPLLGSLTNNGGPTSSQRPGAGSQAIGNGSNSQSYAFDQRGPGFARDAGGAVDIGAIQAFLAPRPASVPVPALGPAALVALALMLGVAGMRRRRR